MRAPRLDRLFAAAALAFVALHGGDAVAAPTQRLNTVLVICDDLGVGDLGCYDAKDNPTPLLDRFAEQGLIHRRFYTSCPSCSPSRAALLTGRDARGVGVQRVLMGSNKHALSPDAVTLGDLYKKAGYNTGYIGKWHLGYGDDHDPLNYGFDSFFGHRGGMMDYFKHTDKTQGYAYDLWRDREPAQVEGYSTALFADASTRFIDQNSDSPFFLYVSLNAPHWDNDGAVPAPREYAEQLGENPTNRESYVGAMRAVDECVRGIVDRLEQHQLLDRTVFIFTSDQGAWSPTGGSNGPLRGSKGRTAYLEGGLRIPFILYWPGREEQTKQIDKPANLIDVLPTLAEHLDLGGEPPGCEGVDLFSDETRPLYAFHDNTDVVHYQGWKYIERPGGDRQLYHLEADPHEDTNLFEARPQKARELAELIARHRETFMD